MNNSKKVNIKKHEDEEHNNATTVIPYQYKDDIERKMKDVLNQIELIGKICDKRMAQSYEEYHNTIKSSKAQLWDDLTKLNFKLIEYKKQNTKEDYINKLKTDLKSIIHQVQMKNNELTINEKTYVELLDEVNALNEEKDFLNKEIRNSTHYNKYLKSKLKQMEDLSPHEVFKQFSSDENKQITNEDKNEMDNIMNMTNSNDTSDNESQLSLKNKQESVKIKEQTKENETKLRKFETYLTKNKDILENKIFEVSNKLNSKYQRINALDKFKNPLFHLLFEKTIIEIDKIKENKFNKISNKDIFFEHKKDLNQSSFINQQNPIAYSHLLHKKDKKEIIKEFLKDEYVKRIIYSIMYNEDIEQ